jgi:hypothetical protein
MIGEFFKKNFPGAWKFFSDFFEAMNSKKSGHSLRKWLAVGFWWIMAVLSFEFTTSDNLVVVLGIHAGMITSLVITYSVSNHADNKLNHPTTPPADEVQAS